VLRLKKALFPFYVSLDIKNDRPILDTSCYFEKYFVLCLDFIRTGLTQTGVCFKYSNAAPYIKLKRHLK